MLYVFCILYVYMCSAVAVYTTSFTFNVTLFEKTILNKISLTTFGDIGRKYTSSSVHHHFLIFLFAIMFLKIFSEIVNRSRGNIYFRRCFLFLLTVENFVQSVEMFSTFSTQHTLKNYISVYAVTPCRHNTFKRLFNRIIDR